jgi:hypothetical protein
MCEHGYNSSGDEWDVNRMTNKMIASLIAFNTGWYLIQAASIDNSHRHIFKPFTAEFLIEFYCLDGLLYVMK